MRTTIAFTITLFASFMLMPQFRAGVGAMLARAGDSAYEATLGSDVAQSIGKTVDAMIGRSAPAGPQDTRPAGR